MLDVRFAVGSVIRFAEEPDATYTVRAINRRYAILIRPINDDDRAAFEGASDAPPETVVYTIIDNETMTRGPHDRIFNFYNFLLDADVKDCLRELESGKLELSRRRSIPVLLCDEEVPVVTVLQAAAERLVDCLDAGVKYDLENASVAMVQDLWILAKAWKDEHDSTPLDEATWRKLTGKVKTHSWFPISASIGMAWRDGKLYLMGQQGNLPLRRVTTVGQFKTLCNLLGVDLKG